MTDENNDEDVERIDVNVEVKGMNELMEQLKEERERRKKAESTLQLIAEKEFAKKKKELNAPEYIDNPEQLMEWQEGKELLEKTSHGPAGVVGLAGQLTDYYDEGSYSSYSEMFADLHRQLHHGSKSEKKRAKDILGKLSHKALKALKDKNEKVDIVVPTDEQIKEGISTVDLINNWWQRTAKKEA